MPNFDNFAVSLRNNMLDEITIGGCYVDYEMLPGRRYGIRSIISFLLRMVRGKTEE